MRAEVQSFLHDCAKEIDRQLMCHELCGLKQVQTENTC